MANRKDSKGRVLKTGESQRKDLTYEYKYKDKDGKRKSVYASDLKTLREKEQKIQRLLNLGVGVGASQVLFGDVVDEYASFQFYDNPLTSRSFENQIEIIRKNQICNKKLCNFTKADGKIFLRELNKTYADGTVKNIHRTCKRIMEYALDKELIHNNPFDFSTKGLLRGKKKEKTVFTDEEFDSLIEEMKTSKVYKFYIPHFIFLRETGLRIAEFIGLTLNDINWENKTISINQQVQREETENRLYFSELKTKSSKSTIPLTPLAEEALKQLVSLCPDPVSLKDIKNKRTLKGFFVTSKSGKLSCSRAWEIAFKRLEDWYNRNHPDKPLIIHPHKFRHTAATNFLKKGLSVPSTQRMLRHASPDMTLDVYTHFSDDDLTKEFNSLFR